MLSRRKAPIIIGLRSSIPFSPQPFLPLPFILLTFVVINCLVIGAPRTSLRLCCLYSSMRSSLSLLSPHFPSHAIPSSLPPSLPRPNRSVRLRQGFALREASGLQPSGIDLRINSVRDFRNQSRQIYV